MLLITVVGGTFEKCNAHHNFNVDRSGLRIIDGPQKQNLKQGWESQMQLISGIFDWKVCVFVFLCSEIPIVFYLEVICH